VPEGPDLKTKTSYSHQAREIELHAAVIEENLAENSARHPFGRAPRPERFGRHNGSDRV
jgi:hypothetical protein